MSLQRCPDILTGNLSVEMKKPFAVMRRAFALSKKVYISVLLDGPKGIY